MAQVVGSQQGASALSLHYLVSSPGRSPQLGFNESEAVLYLLQGNCTAYISGQPFPAVSGCGLHVRPGESLSISNHSDSDTQWLAVVCPQIDQPGVGGHAENPFDHNFPHRLVNSEDRELQATSDRFYKLLIGPETGSQQVSQFIGRIPQSRAPEHYHLYEEVICILSGEGRMWAGDQGREVKPGSLIFLPRGQRHSLECTSAEGMELVGMFYPAGSPAINYQ